MQSLVYSEYKSVFFHVHVFLIGRSRCMLGREQMTRRADAHTMARLRRASRMTICIAQWRSALGRGTSVDLDDSMRCERDGDKDEEEEEGAHQNAVLSISAR